MPESRGPGGDAGSPRRGGHRRPAHPSRPVPIQRC